MSIQTMVGRRVLGVELGMEDGDVVSVRFELSGGVALMMDHSQDCCEHVRLHDGYEELCDLVGETVTEAYESTREATVGETADHGTWTFYRISSPHRTVVLRWLGESNGYYSEDVRVTIEGEGCVP